VKEKKTVYVLSQEDLNRIADIASNVAVEAYRKEIQKAEKKALNNSDKVKQTKKLLNSYRRIKRRLADFDKKFTVEEELEYRWKFIEDLMGVGFAREKNERIAIDQEKILQEDLYCIKRIEQALSHYKAECDSSASDEYKRRYRELYAMYIDDTPMSVQEIGKIENISEKTVYYDIGIACKIMAVYLMGV
jgi:hypothetical protein